MDDDTLAGLILWCIGKIVAGVMLRGDVPASPELSLRIATRIGMSDQAR